VSPEAKAKNHLRGKGTHHARQRWRPKKRARQRRQHHHPLTAHDVPIASNPRHPADEG